MVVLYSSNCTLPRVFQGANIIREVSLKKSSVVTHTMTFQVFHSFLRHVVSPFPFNFREPS